MRNCCSACLAAFTSRPAASPSSRSADEVRCTSHMPLETYRGRAEGWERVRRSVRFEKTRLGFKNKANDYGLSVI